MLHTFWQHYPLNIQHRQCHYYEYKTYTDLCIRALRTTTTSVISYWCHRGMASRGHEVISYWCHGWAKIDDESRGYDVKVVDVNGDEVRGDDVFRGRCNEVMRSKVMVSWTRCKVTETIRLLSSSSNMKPLTAIPLCYHSFHIFPSELRLGSDTAVGTRL